jgi:hypothetical protein
MFPPMLDADYTQLTRENMAFGYDFVKSAKLLHMK